MPAHSFLRGRSAFIAFVAICVCTGGVKGQEILKELEQTDQDATKVPSGHNHEHGAATSRKKAQEEDKRHGGHQHAKSKENKKHGGHKHTAPGDKGGKHTGSHDTSHTGAGTHGDQHQMHGFLGPYPIQREGSGTSWLPDATPHFRRSRYLRRLANHVPRAVQPRVRPSGWTAGDKTFVNGMFMGMAQRALVKAPSACGRCSTRSFHGGKWVSADICDGETADGRTHLIDRQHPHDLFMELATTYSYAFNKNSSVYVCRSAGRTGPWAIGIHASDKRYGHSGSADHAPLAGQHAHHVWRTHGWRGVGHLET